MSELIGLQKPKRASLSDSVADSIAEAIATRVIVPGDRLLEATLVEQLGVSRIPIREALKVLHSQGILEGVAHRGYSVASFDANDTRRIMEVRLSLETFLLQDAIENWRNGIGSPSVLQGPIDQMLRAAQVKDSKSLVLSDLEFHRQIRLSAQNLTIGALWDTIARHVLIVFRTTDLEAIPGQHADFRDWIVAQVEKTTTSAAEIRPALLAHFTSLSQ